MSKATEELLRKWTDRISMGKRYKEQITEQQKWNTYIDQFKGIYDVVLGNQYVPPINEVYAYVQSLKAALFQRNPYIACNAKKTGTVEGSYIWEAILNHDWQEMKIKGEVEMEIDDAILVGHAWNKVGNNVKTVGNGDTLAVESEKLFSNRVSWRDMLFNIGTRRLMVDTLWIAQRIWKPTDDVKDEYGSRAAKLNGAALPAIDERIRKDVLYKDDINFSPLWEIWDARERKIYLMSDEMNKDFLEDPKPWPEYLDEFPYQMLSFNEVPDEPYPMSDIAPWNPQVLEKIKVFTMILNHIKRGNRQLIMRKGVLKEQDKDKYEKGIDGSILDAAVSATADLQSSFKFLDYGQMPADYYMILDRLDQIMDKVRGQAAFQQGGQTKTQSRTEGELQLIQGASTSRSQIKQSRIEGHCENIARHLMFHRKANLDLDMVVNVTGNEPPEILQAFQGQGIFDAKTKTLHFSKEQIQGEYDLSIKEGSTLALDKTTRDQTLREVYQMSMPLASAPSVPPFIAEIVKELLKDFEIKGLEKAFDDQQAQADQKEQGNAMTQEAEMAKVESETQKRQAQSQQINADTIIKTANALGKASGDIHPEASLVK
jgi:hypothetical protein